MLEDRFGNTLTTQSDRAVAHYVAALDHLFAMYNAAGDAIEAAIAQDPDFALAHCVRARALLLDGQPKQAVVVADHAVELAAGASERERAHAAIVAMVTRGDTVNALPLVREHAQAYPRDALPLSFALGVYGLLGFGGFVDHHEQQRDLLESVAAAWGEDWWFDSWLGWSYVETGQVDLGIPLLDRSLEARPDNATTAHGRAHGYYEAGALNDGVAFIETWLPSYGQDEPLHCHLAWHLGLLALQQGDWSKAEQIYLQYICPSASQALPMFTLIDCAAFVWRAKLYGYQFPQAQLDELADFAAQHFAQPHVPFVDYHRTIVGVMTDTEFELSPETGEARATSNALSAAVRAHASGRFADAVKGLSEIMDVLAILGGSNAQRDLIIDTYIAALVCDGDVQSADQVARERAQQRASHLDNKWFALLKGT